jgi:GNAT superfamily N-acetyltransferase
MDASNLLIREGTPRDREVIYRMRHQVYAAELGQHTRVCEGRLSDPLDEYNHYLVAEEDDCIVGFISVTPPDRERYAFDKYFARSDLPFAVDDGLFELRLLTVDRSARGRGLVYLLCMASYRWAQHRGPTRFVTTGHARVKQFYTLLGMLPTGLSAPSGALELELMTAEADRIGEHTEKYRRRFLDHPPRWQLDNPL